MPKAVKSGSRGLLHTRRTFPFAVSLLLILTALTFLPIQAQDVPAEPAESTLPTAEPVIPAEDPTAVPVEETPVVITPDPVVITAEPTTPATEDPVLVVTSEVTPAATLEVTPIVTEEATEIIPAFPWISVFSSDFEGGLPATLVSNAAWYSVNTDAGQAIQSDVTASSVAFPYDLLASALEIKSLLNSGSLILKLRAQNTDFYSVTISAEGTVTLNRSGIDVANGTFTVAPGTWQTWRFEAVNTTISLRVDGVAVLSYEDATPLPAGFAGFGTTTDTLVRLDDLAIDSDVAVTITAPVPTAEPTVEPTIEATLEAMPAMGLPQMPLPMGPISCPAEGQIAMASVNSSGAQGVGMDRGGNLFGTISYTPLRVSDDGRYVIFASLSNNLVAGDTNGANDVFRFDRLDCTTIRVSVDAAGNQLTSNSYDFSASQDGNRIAFNYFGDIYVRDVSSETTIQLGTDIGSNDFVISGDGLYVGAVTYTAYAPEDDNIEVDIYRIEVDNPSNIVLVTVSDDEVIEPGGRHLSNWDTLAISDSGNEVAWVSRGDYGFGLTDVACDYDEDTILEKCYNIFWRDIANGTTRIVSVDNVGITGQSGVDDSSYGPPSISGNGQYVAFNSKSSYDPLDTDSGMDVYVRDVMTDTIVLASVNHVGQNSGAYVAVRGNALSDMGDYLVMEGYGGLTPESALAGGLIYVRKMTTGQNMIVSLNSSGQQPNWGAGGAAINSSGSHVAFLSAASNLVSSDTQANCEVDFAIPYDNNENCEDVFLVSVPAFVDVPPSPTCVPDTTIMTIASQIDGVQAINQFGVSDYAISGNGRYIIFTSYETFGNVNDTNLDADVFLFDRETCTTARLSDLLGVPEFDGGVGSGYGLSISDDGLVIAFVSYSSNVVAGVSNFANQVYVADLNAMTFELVSSPDGITPGNEPSHTPALSSDGRYVAFWSESTDLIANDTNEVCETDLIDEDGDINNGVKDYDYNENCPDVYRYDRLEDTVLRVSLADNEAQSNGGILWCVETVAYCAGRLHKVSISDDGNVVAFTSFATNLAAGDTAITCDNTNQQSTGTNNCFDVFVRNISAGTTVLASRGATVPGNRGGEGPVLSADGTKVLFTSLSTNLVTGDTNARSDVFVRNLLTNTTTRVSLMNGGVQIPAGGYNGFMSEDGRYIIFSSTELASSNPLNVAVPSNKEQIFAYDTQSQVIGQVSKSSAGNSGNNGSYEPYISDDGTRGVFESTAFNLVEGDNNFGCDTNFDQNFDGVYDDNCNDLFVGPIAYLGPVITPTVTASTTQVGQITLTLSGLGSATEFRLERKDNGVFTEIGDTATNSFIDNNSGSSYLCSTSLEYRVRTYRAADGTYSGYSSVVTGKTPACTGTAPTLSLPNNGAFLPTDEPQLEWSAIAGTGITYTVEISRNAAFDPVAESISGLTLPNYGWEPLNDGLYYWRVRWISPTNASPFSAARTFSIDTIDPDMPTFTSGMSFSDATPTFTWTPVTDPSGVSYRVDIGMDPAFAGPIVTDAIVTGTTYTVQPALSLLQGTYYVRVKAVDGATRSSTYTQTDFTVGLTLSPFTSTSSRPTFKWASAERTGATYKLVLDDDFDASNGDTVIATGITTTSYTIPAASAQLANGDFYWRVLVTSPGGSDNPLTVGVYQSLTVNAPIPVPTLTTPPANQTTNDQTPTLNWTAPAYLTPVQFRVEVSLYADFNDLEEQATTSSLSHTTNMLNQGTYFWRVAIVNDGVIGAYTLPRSFTIDITPDNDSVLTLAPAMYSRISDVRTTFTWQAAAGAANVKVQVDDDGDFSSGLIYQSPFLVGTATSFVMPAGQAPLPQGTHYWRVVRMDLAGNIGNPMGTGTEFSVFLGTTPVPNAVTNTRPTFTWKAAGTTVAPTYTLQIANEPMFAFPDYQKTLSGTTLNMATVLPLPDPLTNGVHYWRVLINGNTTIDGLSSSFIVNTLGLPAVPVFTPNVPPAATNDTTPLISWATAANASMYQVEIGTSAAANTVPVVSFASFDTIIDNADWGPASNWLTTDGTYFVRIRSMNSAGVTSNFSATRQFIIDTAPPQPAALVSPVVPAQPPIVPVNSVRPTFTWTKSADAVSYIVQVDTDNIFDSGPNGNEGDAYNSLPTALLTHTIPPTAKSLGQKTRYYWRVVSIDAAQNRSFSTNVTWNSFTLLLGSVPPSGQISIGVPAYLWGEIVPSGLPAFTWPAVIGAPGLTLEISRNSSFSPLAVPIINLPGTATGYKLPPANKLASGIYFWRVKPSANTALVDDTYGTYLKTLTFVVTPNVKPVITNPTVSGFVNDNTPTIAWTDDTSPIPGEAGSAYVIQVATALNFSHASLVWTDSPMVNLLEPLSSIVYMPLTENGTYYVRVARFIDANIADGATVVGAFSDPRKFTVDTQAPANFTLKTPTDAQITNLVRPVFSWNASTGAARYTLEIDTDGNFGNGVLKTVPNLTPLTYTLPLTDSGLLQGNYQWRVIAIDAAGNEKISQSSNALTVFLGSDPVDGFFTTGTASITFKWPAAPGKTSVPVETVTYRLQVDETSDFSTALAYESGNLAVGTLQHIMPANTLTTAGTYYWRVIRTVNGVDNIPNTSRSIYVGALGTGPTANDVAIPFNSGINLTWSGGTPPTNVPLTHYQIAISKSPLFVPLYELRGAVSSSTSLYFPPELGLDGVRFYFRVRGLNNGLPVTEWGPTGTYVIDNVAPLPTVITPPVAPVVSTPGTKPLYGTLRPTFTWKPVSATRYRITLYDYTLSDAVDLNPADAGTTSAYVNAPQTSFTPGFDLAQSSFVISVYAEDGVNDYPNAATLYFNVALGTTPIQNANLTATPPQYVWPAVTGVGVTYALEVARNADFTNDVFTKTGLTTTLYKPSTVAANGEILPAGVYFWRVTPNGSTTASTPRSFTVKANNKPLNPVLRNNVGVVDAVITAVNDNPLTFSWNTVTPTPLEYQVAFSQNNAFPAGSTTLEETPTNSFVKSGDNNAFAQGTMFWRVRAVYTEDFVNVGAWSDVKSFTYNTTDTTPPASPDSLILDSHVFNTARPTFTWTASPSGGAVRYRLTVAMNDSDPLTPPMGIPGLINIPVPCCTYTVPATIAPLLQIYGAATGQHFFWDIEAEDAAGNVSEDFAIRRFYVFLGTEPALGQVTADTTPTFKWTGVVRGTSQWQVQISTNETMTNIIRTSPLLAASSVSYTFLENQALTSGVYYWRAIQLTGTDNTFAGGRRFRVVSSAISVTPAQTTPATGKLFNNADVIAGLPLEWTSVSESFTTTVTYELQISTLATFTPAMTTSIPVNDLIYTWSSLPSNGTYYWRVRALLDGDTGPWSTSRTFIVDRTPPGAAGLTAPINNALLATTRTPTFTWTAGATATRYRVLLSTNSDMTGAFYTGMVNAPTVTHLLPGGAALLNGTYYWQVIALDAAGNQTVSAIRRFKIALP